MCTFVQIQINTVIFFHNSSMTINNALRQERCIVTAAVRVVNCIIDCTVNNIGLHF